MGDNAKIEWTDATWNPVTGCTKVSQGCKHCYAEREWPRLTKLVPAYAGRDFSDVRTHADRLDQPLHWKRPRRIFVNSMSDLFHPDVPFEFIDKVFAVMALAYRHTFQVLTKRADRMREYFNANGRMVAIQNVIDDMETWDGKFIPSGQSAPIIKDWPLPNVWLGVSVEDQAAADSRIQLLIDTPAAVRWVSIEPLIGPVNIKPWLDEELDCPCGEVCCDHRRLDWVVVGGESGPNARPMHPDWVRSLRDQCLNAWPGTPFLFKQWGEWVPADTLPRDKAMPSSCWAMVPDMGGEIRQRFDAIGGFSTRLPDHILMGRVGKRSAGRLLDGVQHDGYPEGKA